MSSASRNFYRNSAVLARSRIPVKISADRANALSEETQSVFELPLRNSLRQSVFELALRNFQNILDKT
ncbi:hypothetical protein DXB18_06660 [Clostridium sp. OM02-18AC]|nr:hypothetical protein DXB18_06660 [Clostridium sp. OM02-18AC]